MIYTNYFTAKKEAKRRGLIECAYGDTPYVLHGEPIHYVCYNKTGDINDQVLIDCYYTMKRIANDHMVARRRQLPGDREQLLRIAKGY